MNTVLVDIDNTVTTWDPAVRGVDDHAKASADAAHESVCRLVRLLTAVGHTIVFLSGRFEEHRGVTERWLKEHDLTYVSLFMRPDGDYRTDDVVKEEIYRRDIQPNWDVWLVLDDRDRVVAMWRRIGLTCLQVREGDF